MAYLGFYPISPIFTYLHLFSHTTRVLSKGLNLFVLVLDNIVWRDEAVDAEVPLAVQGFLVVPKVADRSTGIEDVYGVILEDEDEDSGDEDLDHLASQVTGVGASSSCVEPLIEPHPIRLT